MGSKFEGRVSLRPLECLSQLEIQDAHGYIEVVFLDHEQRVTVCRNVRRILGGQKVKESTARL
jgi:hypothetical protein